ncbi:MAG: fibronectin type III domain-containing protein, partial [Bacteroidales bacterium]|nr:fibronectin type III domain-containing protein [Bacteroidales bacterium]
SSSVSLSSNSITYTDLTPGQTYHVYAATECGNDEHSDWVHFRFTTPELEAMPLPYTQNFEDGVLANWAVNNEYAAWSFGSAVASTGEKSLYISNDGGRSNSYIGGVSSWRNYYSYAYCRLNIDHQGAVRVQFDWRCYGRSYVDCLRAYLVPTSLSPYFSGSNGISDSNVPSGWIPVTSTPALSEYYVHGGGYDWQTNTYDLNITTTGDYYLVFLWMNYVLDNHNPPAAIDNISVSYISDCVFFGGVTVDNLTKTSAEISWSTEGPATQWQIIVTEADSPESASETPVLVSSTPYTVTGLDMNTTYHAYVRPYCSASDQGIWVWSDNFTTLPPCEPPYEISAVVRTNSVSLNWQQPYLYDNFNVYISPTTMTAEQLASADYANVTTTYYSKTGLSAGQTYYAYISSACALGETSEWVDYVFQTTQSDYVTLPYYQDFDGNAVENWSFTSAINSWFVGSAISLSEDKSLYVSNDGGQSNECAREYSYAYAYCMFQIDDRSVVNVSFDWKSYGNYARAFIVPASADPSFTWSNRISDSDTPDGWLSVCGGLVGSNIWMHHSQDVELSNAGNYYFVFFWENSTYVYNPPAAIDNLAIVPLSKENDIISFTFAGMIDAVIDTDNHTVTCSVPYSMNLGGIKPTVTVSQAATISPESNTYIDLNSPFVYIVTSEDGTEQEWTVIANRLPVSSEAEILSFWTDGLLSVDINSANATVDAVVSRMYDISALSPTFVVSNLATINHTNGAVYNFSSPRQFVVTAEDRSVKNWTVNVAYGDSPLGADCVNPYVVDAETDLPYSHSSATAGLYNMYNTYNLEYPLVLEGNDAVYRIDLPYM